jgi:peptidoglycan/LPS O-acetylase OafA/YrhL
MKPSPYLQFKRRIIMVYRWQLKQEERFLMNWAGKIIEVVGISGAIVTIFFDQIARGTTFQWGWLQVLGVLGFACLSFMGVALEKFLQTVKDLLEV